MTFRIFRTYSRRLLFQVCLLEGGLLVIALLWGWWQEIPLRAALNPTLYACILGVIAGLALLTLNYVLIEYGARYSHIFQTLKNLIEADVSPLFRHVDLQTIVGIALISGAAEEVFFRGVLQAQFGVWIASIVFGLAHVWKKTAIYYGIYAALMGLVFGNMYSLSGNLCVPILAHIVNNFVAILYYVHYMLTPTSSPASEG